MLFSYSSSGRIFIQIDLSFGSRVNTTEKGGFCNRTTLFCDVHVTCYLHLCSGLYHSVLKWNTYYIVYVLPYMYLLFLINLSIKNLPLVHKNQFWRLWFLISRFLAFDEGGNWHDSQMPRLFWPWLWACLVAQCLRSFSIRLWAREHTLSAFAWVGPGYQ